jgi:hypothetical protein
MPGIAVRIEFREDQAEDVIAKLCAGIEGYFSERTK